MQRQQHRNKNLKWWLVALVVLIVAVGGYFVGKAMNGDSNSESSSAVSSSKQMSSSSSSALSSSQSSEQSTTSESASVDSSSADSSKTDSQSSNAVGPYSVSTEEMNALGSFEYHGVNTPESLDLSFNDKTGAGTAAFNWRGGNQPAVYDVMYEEIPTTPIRVFSANGNSVRTVKVNTRIHIESLQSGDSTEIDTAGDLYAFKNRSGGISIATPNYAGNVAPDQYDVLQEIVHN